MKQPVGKSKFIILINRYYNWLYFIFLGFIIMIAIIYWLYPKYQLLNQSGIFAVSKAQAQLQASQEYLARLNELLANYQKINQSDKEVIARIIPASDQIPQLLLIFDTLARSNGLQPLALDISGSFDKQTKQKIASAVGAQATATTVNVTTSSVAQATKILNLNPNIKTIDVSANFGKASYEAIKAFLTSLENTQRLIDVVSLNFSTDLTAFTINLKTYYID